MIAIAFVQNRTSGVVKSVAVDWGKLSQRLSRCDLGEKDGVGWMPADIDPGKRIAERVKSISLLVLDVEAKAETVEGAKKIIGPEPPAPDAMIAEVELCGWRCILHTSYNHTAEHPRYRLTFDLARPLKREEVKPLGLHVASLLGIGDCIDTGCLEPARLFYLPRCPIDRQSLFRHAETQGIALSVDELIADAAKFNKAKDTAPRRVGQSASVIEAFNAAHGMGSILEQYGYESRGRGRWLCPGSTTGLAGVRILPDAVSPRVYSSHGGDPLNDGHAHDAFDLWRILRHGGDMSAAVKEAAQKCGVSGATPQARAQHQPTDESAPASDHAGRKWPDPLADDAFYGLAGEIVRAIEPQTESDSAAILLQVLVAFGALVGRGPHFPIEGDQHHSNLFALIVGETSKARKGTSWGRVREIFSRAAEWPKVVDGLSTGEGLKYAVRDRVTKVERDDKGFAKEVETDPGVTDKRLLVVEAEFAQVLKQAPRAGNTLSATIRSAWDSGNLRTLTKNDPITATGAHICIIGHITSNELRAELTATDSANGFANRFLFMAVRRSKALAFGGQPLAKDVVDDFAKRIAEAAGKAQQLRAVNLTQSARAVWSAVYERLSEGYPGLYGAVTARAEAQCLRLALAYALMCGEREIDRNHLLAALAVWDRAAASARCIFGDALGDPVADQILNELRARRPNAITRTEISRILGRHQKAERIEVALKLLEKLGLARCERVQTGGAPAEQWVSL